MFSMGRKDDSAVDALREHIKQAHPRQSFRQVFATIVLPIIGVTITVLSGIIGVYVGLKDYLGELETEIAKTQEVVQAHDRESQYWKDEIRRISADSAMAQRDMAVCQQRISDLLIKHQQNNP